MRFTCVFNAFSTRIRQGQIDGRKCILNSRESFRFFSILRKTCKYIKTVRKMKLRTPPVINDSVWVSARDFDFYHRDRRAAKAHACLRICTVSPEPSRTRVHNIYNNYVFMNRPKFGTLASEAFPANITNSCVSQ